MMRPTKLLIVLWLAACVLLLACQPASAAEPLIEPRHPWSNVFGDKPIDVRFIVKSPRDLKGRVGWAFTANQRTIARGEVKLAAEANKPASVDFRLPVPPVKDGVIFAALLTVNVFVDGQEKAEATLEKPIWIFPENPFHDRAEWLKEIKQELNVSGLVKAEDATKVGRLTGAKLLVTGSVSQVDKKVYLVAKVMGTETGRVLGAAIDAKASDELAQRPRRSLAAAPFA